MPRSVVSERTETVTPAAPDGVNVIRPKVSKA